MFNKLKKQNGEKFAQAVRKHAPAALEYESILKLLKHAGSNPDDVPNIAPLIHDICIPKVEKKTKPKCPIKLLDKAGYDAYYVTDRESQDRIKKYFKEDEQLCTFGTDRWKSYRIINAVKKNVDEIRRSSSPKRDDEYGTSVISIQVTNGFISIKNRYNDTVSNPDATFNNNLDKIIDGLRAAVEHKFGITLSKGNTPPGFMLADGSLLKVNQEINGIYYGDKAIIHNGNLIEMKDGIEFLYEYFIFDLSTKTFRKYDDSLTDSFADDMNKYYGGLKTLRVDSSGNLFNGDEKLIGVA